MRNIKKDPKNHVTTSACRRPFSGIFNMPGYPKQTVAYNIQGTLGGSDVASSYSVRDEFTLLGPFGVTLLGPLMAVERDVGLH